MSKAARFSTRTAIGLIDLYQAIRGGRPSPCRFSPSCSTYCREALCAHGVARGTWLGIRRVLRCRPRGGWGFDPVPAK